MKASNANSTSAFLLSLAKEKTMPRQALFAQVARKKAYASVMVRGSTSRTTSAVPGPSPRLSSNARMRSASTTRRTQ